jgi:hypothetical protein
VKKTRRTLLGSLLAVVCALGVLFFASTPLRSLNAEGTEAKTCADITFGTTEYTATGALGTGSFSTTNFTVTSVSGSSFYCPKDNASNSSRYSAKIGTTTNGGNLTFNFPAENGNVDFGAGYHFGLDGTGLGFHQSRQWGKYLNESCHRLGFDRSV